LLQKYSEYATSEEAKTVMFVNKFLDQASHHWIDIIELERYSQSEDELHI
jgi:hypothetical protein